MPYVNVKLAGELEPEKKAVLADRIAEALEDVAGKPRQYTYIVFEEVSREDWAIGGRLLSGHTPPSQDEQE